MRALTLLLALLQLQQLNQLLPFPLEQGPPLSPASVSGAVIDSQTKQPLAGVTVMAQGSGGLGGKLIAVTGNDGRFSFPSVPPGQYAIEASRAGYVSEMIGNPREDGLNGPILRVLNPGQVLSEVRVVLTPGGVITGRLTDEQGEAVAGSIVQAFRTIHRNGLRERAPVQSVISNDLGEYRFFMLKP